MRAPISAQHTRNGVLKGARGLEERAAQLDLEYLIVFKWDQPRAITPPVITALFPSVLSGVRRGPAEVRNGSAHATSANNHAR